MNTTYHNQQKLRPEESRGQPPETHGRSRRRGRRAPSKRNHDLPRLTPRESWRVWPKVLARGLAAWLSRPLSCRVGGLVQEVAQKSPQLSGNVHGGVGACSVTI
eukprot:7020447-Pyramimonas_sp.AAC.1